MDFLASPGAFWTWLVNIGATEVARWFLVVLALAALRYSQRARQKISKWLTTRNKPETSSTISNGRMTAAKRIARRDDAWLLRRAVRRYLLRHNRWIRKHRFDSAWIQREVSRGHACFVIMVLWFGFWVLALGLKEVFLISEGPLASSPKTAFGAALPMYAFELLWLRFSGRAGQLINYRNKVRIWRWWH